jgi:putative radical SAM enzyme (TIGR03279 family)
VTLAKKGAVVAGVIPGSIGEEMGIEPGDRVVSINGQPVNDILEYRYLADDQYLEVEVSKAGGEVWVLEIEKEYGEGLGLEFDAVVFDRIRSCINRCLFCFVDQLPPGMRKTLYVKDDDYRLSFLYGNFISLTNLGRRDLEQDIGDEAESSLYIGTCY